MKNDIRPSRQIVAPPRSDSTLLARSIPRIDRPTERRASPGVVNGVSPSPASKVVQNLPVSATKPVLPFAPPVLSRPALVQCPALKTALKKKKQFKPDIGIPLGRTKAESPKASPKPTLPGSSTQNVKKVAKPEGEKAEPPKKPLLRRKKRFWFNSKRSLAVYGAAAIVFLGGVMVVVQGLLLNKQVDEQVKVLSATNDSQSEARGSTQVPSEEKLPVNHLENYRVAADLPRILSIDSLGVKARILQVGVDENNQMQSPRNIYDTAWYTGSSKPGEMGAAVIDGHYSGPNTAGVFSRLDKLRVGDEIVVEKGDGSRMVFAVVRSETVSTADVNMAKLLVSADTSRAGLNIITCAGDYNAKDNRFADRTVVYAVKI